MTTSGRLSAVRYEKDGDGIVTLTLDDPTARANTMNDLYTASMAAAVDRLHAEVAGGAGGEGVTGVVVTSAKKTFCAGGDLTLISQYAREDAARVFLEIEAIKASLRRLETFPRPVVAAIGGSALGGGLEICLACNHRIAVEDPEVELGLPEATLGLLPGGGGLTRTVRMLGLRTALTDVLLPGTRFDPVQALETGLVDELVRTRAELVPAAKAWIRAHPEASTNPWDRPGYAMPGGTAAHPPLAALLPTLPALLRKRAKGAVHPAARAILSAAVEGAQVDFDTASRIESRYVTNLIVGQDSKNLIQALFFDRLAIRSGSLRPTGFEPWKATRLGVLGAGRMGAGIAYVCAEAGMEVVLKDVTAEIAERGKAYSAGLLDKAVAAGHGTDETKAELLGRIIPTANPADLAGCDLVIEAVFEEPALKSRVFAEVAAHVAPGALLCSNTSTLPITELAAAVDRPRDFIGLHFFSPVDRMPLVEIVRGTQTSDEALAKAYDVVQQIGKTPIVVNDSRGFYTTRVVLTMLNEGLAMLGEGVHPVSLERAATQAGYPVGPLQLADELSMELLVAIATATAEAATRDGIDHTEHPGTTVARTMVGIGRPSRLHGAAFYEYADGRRQGIWPGLTETFPVAETQPPLADVTDRMLFAGALETARCLEEGVITSVAAANIGSIMGIGFPARTGGAAQFITGYQAADAGAGGTAEDIGLAAFARRADELAVSYGERFAPTPHLRRLVATTASFPPGVRGRRQRDGLTAISSVG
jgi:3-hydroxyacyl-CoA dehydrogenase/enoyl-CoA hydratase/3-hydroxybutyryl-CoA epimerase